MTSAIMATGLRKSFGGTAVLDGIDLEVAAGTTFSLLAVNTGHGHVRNLLESAARRGEADDTVEVRGRTSYGDITIHRS